MGYFYEELWHHELLKIAQSGNTGAPECEWFGVADFVRPFVGRRYFTFTITLICPLRCFANLSCLSLSLSLSHTHSHTLTTSHTHTHPHTPTHTFHPYQLSFFKLGHNLSLKNRYTKSPLVNFFNGPIPASFCFYFRPFHITIQLLAD